MHSRKASFVIIPAVLVNAVDRYTLIYTPYLIETTSWDYLWYFQSPLIRLFVQPLSN